MSFGLIAQFIMQTALIVVVAILFIPIISNIIFGPTGMFANTSAETQAHRDALWNWTIVLFIAAIAGNVVWYFRALQRQEAGTIEY